MDDICAIHLGPNGVSYTTRAVASAKFQDDMSKALVSGLTTADAAARTKQAYANYRVGRFYSYRDASQSSMDVSRDTDVARQLRWLSPTRDMMRGPAWDGAYSQALFANGDNSIPVFGRNEGAGFDSERFVDECMRLRNRGIITEAQTPDFDSDESMVELFNLVRKKALDEAQGKRVDVGDKNRVIDSAPGIYLFSELLNRTNILIEEDYTELWARRIFAIRNLNTWMPQWLFRRVDSRTKLPEYVDIERLPSNAPRGSENVDGEIRNLAFYHHGASWSKLELARWAEAQSNGAPNFSLDGSRMTNATRMMNFKEDLITFFGDTDRNILGLFSAESKTKIARIDAGSIGGKFGAVDPVQDRNLLTSQVKAIRLKTEKVLQPDTIMLSVETFQYVTDTLYGDESSDAGNNKTVLDMAMQSLERLGIKDVLEVPEVGYSEFQRDRLKAQGLTEAQADAVAGGTGDKKQAMVIGNRSGDVVEMIVAKDRVVFPTEERNDRVETRMMQGSGGLAVYKPAGWTIVTDVGPSA